MKSILCYGDSNTWGFVPGSFGVRERYDRATRWTGRLQQLLDPAHFYVIEEGLNGRTTNLNYTSKPPGFRGTEFFSPIIYTHAPLDLIIIMLGLNDLKKEFHDRSSAQITQGIKELIDMALSINFGPGMLKPPPVLIVSIPMPVHTTCEAALNDFDNALPRAQGLAHDLEALVNSYEKDIYFVDAAPHVQLSPVDGLHFDEKAHEKFSLLMNKTVRHIFHLS